MQKRREERENQIYSRSKQKWKEKDFTTAFFPLALGKNTKF